MRNRIFVLWLAVNQLICAVVFFPWTRERETISGLMGRWWLTEKGWKFEIGCFMSAVIDKLHSDDTHCAVTFEDEQFMRDQWYK